MKFIHVSDLHLDSKIDGIPTDKSRIRREEIVNTFERLVAYASNNQVHAIIIAGDMFDTSRVTIKTRERVIGTVKKYSNIDFLYVAGNHDEINFLSQIEEFPENLIIFSDNWQSIDYGDCVVSGINLTNLNQKIIYDTLILDKSKVNIVAIHGQVAGYNCSDKAEIISLPKLKDKNIDYLALGHIHSYSRGVLDERGEYVYSGCLDGRGFDELGDKGFVLLEYKDQKLQSQFIKFSSRNLYEIEYDVSDKTSFYELCDFIEQDLLKKIDANSLVKVVLKGKHKTDFYIDKFSLATKLNNLFFFAKVYDKTELEVNLSDYEFDKSVRGEFVRAVWESELDSQEKNKIIMCGLSALKGEEI
ncbi:MAG: DNA repair exonuclease [Clostridiales bacterium]|nr:DNA repair exonuclease [Clostridiales bacterium]